MSPISTRLPIDTFSFDETEVPAPWSHRTSYIAGKSAPTTPRILSRSPSQTRLGYNTSTKLANSKSYTQLTSAERRDPLSKNRLAIGLSGLRKKKSKTSSGSTDAGEWLYRTGTGITTETRESKGQSWLISRESSTSLVAQGDEDESDLTQYQSITPRSTKASRAPSRLTSARESRRGSKVSSRADLTYFATPAGQRTPGTATGARFQELGDYFGSAPTDSTVLAGPDFVYDEEGDEEEGSENEEEKKQEDEIRELASQENVGMGGVIDRMFNWSLFDETNDTDEETSSNEQAVPHQPEPLDARSGNISSAARGSEVPGQISELMPGGGSKAEESYGWADAAWLLSVASKVLL